MNNGAQMLVENLNPLAKAIIQGLGNGLTLGQMQGCSDESFESVYANGYVLYNAGRYEDALKVFRFLVINNHLERRYHLAVAGCLQMLKKYDDALESYGFATILDPYDPISAFHASECFIAKGDIEGALEALDGVVAGCVDDKNARLKEKALAIKKMILEKRI